ncbi:HEPACAM family member 2-like [Narcine bancroftii]|uniref:HEPACAM family member 2-like n=1 Tax=Narcine bancroftii TaxID=1343680 RepID=UPI003831DD6F
MDVRNGATIILCFALLCAVPFPARCLEVRLEDREVHGMLGKTLDLRSRYRLEAGERLHSITWRVDRDYPTRILQYITGKDTTLPSSPYRHRIRFDSATGSLCLFNFSRGDRGLYQITLTTVDGIEHKDGAKVEVYGPVVGIRVAVIPNQTSLGPNLTLSCTVTGGSQLRIWWSKVGRNITGSSRLESGHSRLLLPLSVRSWEDCGTYTCSAWNLLNRVTRSLNLTGLPGLPQCQTMENARLRLRFLLVAPALFCLLLLSGILACNLRVGKLALKKARRETQNCGVVLVMPAAPTSVLVAAPKTG